MAIEYYTTVTTTDRFWQKLIAEKIESGFSTTFIGDDAGFTIKSKYGPALQEIIELSNRYPDERFTVVVTSNNEYNDVIDYYDLQGGVTTFSRVEPLYHFYLSENVNESIDLDIVEDFKIEIIEALNRLLDFNPSYDQLIDSHNPKEKMISNIRFEYGRNKAILSARVVGRTFIKIDLVSSSNDYDMNFEE
jgi:hypothetical protein